MRWLWIACLLLASLLPVSAEDWTTEDGHTYRNVTVLGQEDDGVRITYNGGVGKIPYYELPVEIQKRFGQDIDSLAAKKQAVDLAIEDAVHAAANAQVVMPAVVPGLPGAPQHVTPGTSPPYTPPPGTAPQGTGPSSIAPNGTASTPGPSGKPGATVPGTSATPGAAPNATPGNSAVATNPAGTPNKPGTVPGATATTAPGAHPPGATTTPGASHGPGGQAQSGTESVELPSLDMPHSHTPQPDGISAAGGKPLNLTVANYSYNTSLDVCYLDSPPIDIYLRNEPKTPPGQGSSLTLRVVTDGRTPQVPDRYELTFVCVGGTGGDLAGSDIVFTTDSGLVAVPDSDRKDSGALPGGGQPMRYASFYLPAAQLRQFAQSKELKFSVGRDTYLLDERGADTLHNYLSDSETLQPATSSIVRTVYKWLANIPSFFSILSTICEYAILGSFALLVAASIAAFILGISRFIKM